MNRDTNVTTDYLKAVSGKFDLDTIFNLDLNGKSISKLGALNQCTNLVFMNLKSNKLSNLTGLNNLTQLVLLDLSFNMLTSIDSLDELPKLKYLKLQGNKIDKVKSKLSKLKNLKSLENLLLQDVNGNSANPVCKLENYRSEVFSLSSSLKSLDSIRREYEPFQVDPSLFNVDLSKLDKNSFSFNIKDKIELNPDNTMKELSYPQFGEQLNKKYAEFLKEVNEAKNSCIELREFY